VVLVPSGLSEPLVDRQEAFFNALADATGGGFASVRADRDVGPALLAALDRFRASYVLRYMPRGVEPGGWHAVTVRLTRPGKYEIHAQPGYAGG
jgi:hypothetical protein